MLASLFIQARHLDAGTPLINTFDTITSGKPVVRPRLMAEPNGNQLDR